VVELTGENLTLSDVVRVARGGAAVSLSAGAREEMGRTLAWVQSVTDGAVADADGEPLPVYGVNTGYGSLARVRLGREQIRQLSSNLVQSHAAGTGPLVEPEVVRGMILLRANALATGASGCRPALVESLAAMLNADLVPEVPSRGSCGSSGDLAPLAHLGLVVFDTGGASGHVRLRGARMTGERAMAEIGVQRLTPLPKEGLAMCNGAQLTTSYAALACHDAAHLVVDAEIAAAMTFEALRGTTRAYHPAVHALRPYAGACAAAANLLRLVRGSTLADSLPEKVQDAYALRCVPQVHGAVRDGLAFAAGQVSVELNAATDNPLILVDVPGANKAFSAGLFHGEPVGLACDHLRLVLCELGSISERRIYRLATGTLSARLPPLLVRKDRPGLGLLAPQATAAALVAENRSLAWPAGADSLPTCEDQEDLVAMSTTAARRAWQTLQTTRRVVAIELFSAFRALRWRLDHEPEAILGAGTRAAFDLLSEVVTDDLVAPGDATAVVERAVRAGAIEAAVRAAVPDVEGVWAR